MSKCYCDKCCQKIESTAVVVSDGVMQITVLPMHTYINYRRYRFKLCQALPEMTGIEPVVITDGTNFYPLIDSNGQPVTAGMLTGHEVYMVKFGVGGVISGGSIPPHFTVYKGLSCVKYSSTPTYQND